MSLLTSSKHAQNQAFQALKPVAVDLSQAVLCLQTGPSHNALIEERLQALYTRISTITTKGGQLDAKLADYVFFPVSQVLKSSQKVSLRCLELSLSILSILVQHGWKHDIQSQLAQQLLILCTLLAGDRSMLAQGGQTTAELQLNALHCLGQTLIASNASITSSSSITSDVNIPHLGQTITVVLQALQNEHPEVQLAANDALAALIDLQTSDHILFNFLPGIISALTKGLTRRSARRQRPELLVGSLTNLGCLFQKVFEDGKVAQEAVQTSLKTAAPQIKIALESIARLQNHDRVDVKVALSQICIKLLRYCRKTLEVCVELAIETMLALSTSSSDQALHFELVMLVTTDTAVLTALQTVLYTHTQSMIRIMQGADDDVKVRRLEQIGSAYHCIVDAGGDLTTTNKLLLRMFRDCVKLVLSSKDGGDDMTAAGITSLQLAGAKKEFSTATDFSLLVSTTGPSKILHTVRVLMHQVATSVTTDTTIDDMVSDLQTSKDDGLIADFWLVLQHLSAVSQDSLELDAVIDIDPLLPSEQIDEVYSFGLSYLGSEEQIPAVSSLSLQALALKAQTTGKEFKYELIDALYPVLHALATPNDVVQHDGIATLNIFTSVCGYASVKELIVDNVDYLTNAVSLKLNAFDISPQAPQVLLMMIRLAGPSLVPYLEDSIDSIFAALEDYHGYPLLVEFLFKTLAVIADEGTKAPLLDAREDRLLCRSNLETWQAISIAELASAIRERGQAALQSDTLADVGPTPQEPWTTKAKDDADEAPAVEDVEIAPPAPKTYNTLIKITELTQHFLPSASTALRMSLLSLIRTTIPAIARHENTFLPLINTLWPEIVARLDDDEPAVRTATLEVITVLCQYAQDFLRSRISDLWPHLKQIWQETVAEADVNRQSTQTMSFSKQTLQALQRMQSGPEDYSNTSLRMLWRALITLLVGIVRAVPITPEMFDDALRMVRSELTDASVLEVFERENADAVWLLHLREGRASLWQPTQHQGFVQLELQA